MMVVDDDRMLSRAIDRSNDFEYDRAVEILERVAKTARLLSWYNTQCVAEGEQRKRIDDELLECAMMIRQREVGDG